MRARLPTRRALRPQEAGEARALAGRLGRVTERDADSMREAYARMLSSHAGFNASRAELPSLIIFNVSALPTIAPMDAAARGAARGAVGWRSECVRGARQRKGVRNAER